MRLLLIASLHALRCTFSTTSAAPRCAQAPPKAAPSRRHYPKTASRRHRTPPPRTTAARSLLHSPLPSTVALSSSSPLLLFARPPPLRPRPPQLEAIVSRIKGIARLPTLHDSPISALRFVAVSATIPVRPAPPPHRPPSLTNPARRRLPCLPPSHHHPPTPSPPPPQNFTDVALWLGASPRGARLFGEEYRAVEVRVVVHGYREGFNDFLFERHLKEYIFSVVQAYRSDRPALVFCRRAAAPPRLLRAAPRGAWLLAHC